MTDKVNPSINRPAEAFKTAGAIAYAGGREEGFIVEAGSPTEIAVQDGGITEGNLNAFNYSTAGLDVTVDGGEAFVFGSWLAIDTQTTVTLADNTSGQQIYVGWNKDGTDDVIVGLQSAFDNATGNTDQKIPIGTFDTSGGSVSSSADNRTVGSADPTDNLEVVKEYQITASSGSTPAFDGELTNAYTEQLGAFDVTVTPTNELNQTYGFNYDDGKNWNNGSWDVPLTVNWDTDPGSDLDLTVRIHKRT